jgi:hypothetical protein
MNSFLKNAGHLFDVARSESGAGDLDFSLMVSPDGGIHMAMETAFQSRDGAQAAYRVTRSRDGVRVTGQANGQTCVLEQKSSRQCAGKLLQDQPLYNMISPRLISPPAS